MILVKYYCIILFDPRSVIKLQMSSTCLIYKELRGQRDMLGYLLSLIMELEGDSAMFLSMGRKLQTVTRHPALQLF